MHKPWAGRRGVVDGRGSELARRSREAIQKRLRERKRAEKAALKRQKRLERKKGLEPGEGELEAGGIVLAGQTEVANPDKDEAVAVGEIKTDDQHQLQEDPRPLLPTTD